jgi:hypothetical protein
MALAGNNFRRKSFRQYIIELGKKIVVELVVKGSPELRILEIIIIGVE